MSTNITVEIQIRDFINAHPIQKKTSGRWEVVGMTEHGLSFRTKTEATKFVVRMAQDFYLDTIL